MVQISDGSMAVVLCLPGGRFRRLVVRIEALLQVIRTGRYDFPWVWSLDQVEVDHVLPRFNVVRIKVILI